MTSMVRARRDVQHRDGRARAIACLCMILLAAFSLCAVPLRAQTEGGPFLGVQTVPLTPGLAAELGVEQGIFVAAVQQDSPAQKAGLRPTDIIMAIDGQSITEPSALTSAVRAGIPGLPVALTVSRGGRVLSLQAMLGRRSGQPNPVDLSSFEEAGPATQDTGRHMVAGATLVTLNPVMAATLGLGERTRGAVVLAVEPGSSAEESGFKKGDVIFAINGRRTSSALAVAETFIRGMSAGGHPASALMYREGDVGFMQLSARAQGYAEKWGVLYQLAGNEYATGDNAWIVRWGWLDRGKELFGHVYRPGAATGTTNIYKAAPDGTIDHYVGKVDANGHYLPTGEMWKVEIQGNAVDLRSSSNWTRNTYTPNGSGYGWTHAVLRKNGTVKTSTPGTYRPVDKAEIERLAAAYKARVAQQQADARAAEQARKQSGGGGGLLGALGGAALGALAGGNSEQIVGAAMKGAAMVDPNMAALDSVGDSMITGNSGAIGVPGIGGGASQAQAGGGSYPTRPNLLNGSAACSMMNQGNYREVGLSGGNDVQLKTMCAQAHEYYSMYLNAIRQGYSEADANRTYAAHEGAAQNAISFYQSAR